MRTKTGTFVPKTGANVHLEADVADHRAAIAAAVPLPLQFGTNSA